MSVRELETIFDKFNSLTHKTTKFLSVQNDSKEDFKNLVKTIYDFTKSTESSGKKSNKCALPKLIVQDFDEEQIWQQIELQNTECWDQLVWDVANSVSNKSALEFPVNEAIEVSEPEPSEHDDSDKGLESVNEDNSEDERTNKKKMNKQKSAAFNKKPQGKPSIVDDKFFKLKDMEQFLLKEERNDGKPTDAGSDSESIDLFDEIDDEDSENEEEGGKKVMYGDFFQNDDENEYEDDQDDEMPEKLSKKKKKEKKVTFLDEEIGSEDDEQLIDTKNIPEGASSSDNDDESNEEGYHEASPKPEAKRVDEKQSEFELRQQRLKQHISRLEAKTLSEAPWQLKGEIDALKRPQNSLLENFVDFDLTTRPAPIITEQTTLTLEEIIKQRVKDKAWDDVQKKEKPVDDQLAFRKTEVLDHSKSKQSLAQVYEAEYLKQKQALTDDNSNEKEPENHKEVREAMDRLFSKLDALCHYHYTPKPAQPEVRIVSNTPAIMMEEVAPVSVSDAALLAPEEVKRKRKGDLMSKEERTDTDKKRERRKKKIHQQKKGKVAKVTEHRNTQKAQESGNDKSLKTSKAFFQQLNDDTTSLLKNKKRNIKNKGQ